MTEFAVAVRELVAFCHRSGDIDHRFTPSPTGEQGMEGHQRVYRRRPASYQREFSVSYRHRQGEISLLLRGRADGYDPGKGLVEEIKTCRVQAGSIPETVSRRHLAQARLYGAMIALQEERDALEVCLTWFNIDSGEEHTLSQQYSREELLGFLEDTLQRFSNWLQTLAALRQQRDESLEALDFPHGAFRPGQRDIAELVYKCVDQGGQLMVEAPTGIGKTAAVLYPALKALARDKHEAIAFVTARTVGRRTAEDTLARFRDEGARIGALSLTAKERICFSPGKACHGDDCPYARGYYDRLPRAMEHAIAVPALRRMEVEELAREFDVCPYYLADDLLPWMPVVIADLHYLYSLYPKLGGDGRRWTVLLDEAHNLPERARGMYSARLGKAALMKVRREAGGAVARALDSVNRAMLELQREQWREPDWDSREQLPQGLIGALHRFVAAVGEELASQAGFLQRQPLLLDFYFDVLQWLRVAECWGDDFRLELSRSGGRQSLVVALNCLDPSRLLRERQQGLHSLSAFSATLTPGDWMRSMLGLEQQAVCRRMASPFAAEQLVVRIATGVDTRYRAREASLEDLARSIEDWLRQHPGNCIVYFPSYRYLQACLDRLGSLASRTLWQQQSDQAGPEREALFELLAEKRDVAAFCILGGVFGEGIDLPGEQLCSVVIAGVGLPQVNRDREQLRQWYQQRYGAGFEYAYLYPGMQKVNQALGRVIRSPGDQGQALLIDSRYASAQYRDLLPRWWDYRPLED